jgi:hypothetical protein
MAMAMAMALTAAGSSSRTSRADEAPKPSNAGSDAGCAEVEGHSVCALLYEPSSLDPTVETVPSGGDRAGMHYACHPGEAARWNGQLLVYFVGTGDNPERSHGLAELACSLGFAAIAPMYENQRDARFACGANSACYDGMHREVLYGGDSAPDPIRVDEANSILHRLDTVLTHLADRDEHFPPWTAIRARVTGRDFTSVVLAGHSQGSGHAVFLARDHQVARVIALAGPSDRLDSGKPSHAAVEWVAQWRSDSKTPPARLLGYNHEDDGILVYRQLAASYDALGVDAASCERSDRGELPATCRRVRMTPSRCRSFEAHIAVALRHFGSEQEACKLDGKLHDNTRTWTFLLTTPL